VIEHAHASNWDRKGGRNLCYKHNQQNQVHEHQCNETGKELWRRVVLLLVPSVEWIPNTRDWNLMKIHEKSVTSYRSFLWVGNLIIDDGNWNELFLSGPNWIGVFSPLHLRMETDPVFETSCFYSQEHQTVEKIQRASNSVQVYAVPPSLEECQVQSVTLDNLIGCINSAVV
jgi:hypothetical protein